MIPSQRRLNHPHHLHVCGKTGKTGETTCRIELTQLAIAALPSPKDCVSIFSLTVLEAQRIMEVAAKASGADPWDRPAKARYRYGNDMSTPKSAQGSNVS